MEDIERIADLVVAKLKEGRAQRSDEEFAMMLAEALHEHRAPCHDLSDEDVKSLRDIITTAKKFDRGVFWVLITLGSLILKTAWDFFAKNIHWGQ